MMKLTYYRSEDPLLDTLLKSQENIFDQPYAGYLLFLFGRADQEVASWFATNLIALDSLTGSSLAGLVFAERVRLKAQRVVTRWNSYKYVAPLRLGDNVDISQIRYERPFPSSKVLRLSEHDGISSGSQFPHIERLIDEDLDAIYEPELEISAITYGSDKVASELGIQDRLPCIVLLNALPSGSVEVISLRDQELSDVIHFLRRVVAHFNNRSEFESYFELMTRIRALVVALDDRVTARNALQEHLLEERGGLTRRELWSVRLRKAFSEGNYKEYKNIVRKSPLIDGDLKKRLRTFLALNGFRSSAPMGEDASTGDLGAADIGKTLDDILPPQDEILLRHEQLCREHLVQADEQLAAFDETTEVLRGELQALSRALAECKVPDLQKAFRDLTKGTSIKSASKSASAEAWGVLKGWLKPEILIKLAEHFHKL